MTNQDLFLERYLFDRARDYDEEAAVARVIRLGHPVFDLVSRLAASRDVDSLRLLYSGSAPLHSTIADYVDSRGDGGFASRAGTPFNATDPGAVHAVRALAGLGLALTGDVPAEGPLRSALAWYADAHGSLATHRWDPRRVDWGQPRLLPLMDLLAEAARAEHSAGPALATAVTLYALATGTHAVPKSRRGQQASVTVLLVKSGEGVRAGLRMSLAKGLPPGLAPAPRQMALFSADPKFQQSLDLAWSQTGAGHADGTVLWSIKEAEGPSSRIEGASAGAALATALDEIRRLSRPLSELRVVRRLQSSTAIIGRIDGHGNLRSVEGYDGKLAALGRDARVIVPEADADKAKDTAAYGTEVVPAARWREAASKARRRNAKVILRQSAATGLVLAVVAGFFAWRQETKATAQTAVATARQVASLTVADLGANLDTAQLLAVGAYQMHDDAATEAALFQAATASPQLVTYYQAPGPVTSLGTSADGQVIVAGTVNGGVAWFDPVTGAERIIQTKIGAISNVSVDGTGAIVMASSAHTAIIWQPKVSDHLGVISPVGGDISSIAISPSGVYAAVVQGSPQSLGGTIIVRNMQTGAQAESRSTSFYGEATFTSSGRLTVSGCGQWTTFQLPALAQASSGGKGICPATNAITGSSPSGRYSAYATYGNVTAWESADTSRIFSANEIAPAGAISSVIVSDDGKRAAIVASGSIFVAPLGPYTLVPDGAAKGIVKLSSNGDTAVAAFMGSSSRLASAAGKSIALWDLRHLSRIGSDTGVRVPFTGMGYLPPDLSISPDGRTLATAGGLTPFTGYQIGKSLTKLGVWADQAGETLFGWRGNKPLFLDHYEGKIIIRDSAGYLLRRVNSAVDDKSYITSILPAKNSAEAVFVDQAADIWVVNLANGRVSRFAATPGSFAFSRQNVAVSEDGKFAMICDLGHLRAVAVDLENGKIHVVGSGKADGVLNVNGNFYIQRDSGPLEVWDESGSHLLRSLPGNGGYASAMTATRDGSRIARLAENGVVSILSTVTGDELGTFALPSDGGESSDPWLGTSMQFTPDGGTLFTETNGEKLTRWTISMPALVKIVCATAGRAMTSAEWRNVVGKNPPTTLPCQGGSL